LAVGVQKTENFFKINGLTIKQEVQNVDILFGLNLTFRQVDSLFLVEFLYQFVGILYLLAQALKGQILVHN
jgi:hypothetical protein